MVGARRHDARGLCARAGHRLRSATARRGPHPASGFRNCDRRRHRDVAGAASPAAALSAPFLVGMIGLEKPVSAFLAIAFELDDLTSARVDLHLDPPALAIAAFHLPRAIIELD